MSETVTLRPVATGDEAGIVNYAGEVQRVVHDDVLPHGVTKFEMRVPYPSTDGKSVEYFTASVYRGLDLESNPEHQVFAKAHGLVGNTITLNSWKPETVAMSEDQWTEYYDAARPRFVAAATGQYTNAYDLKGSSFMVMPSIFRKFTPQGPGVGAERQEPRFTYMDPVFKTAISANHIIEHPMSVTSEDGMHLSIRAWDATTPQATQILEDRDYQHVRVPGAEGQPSFDVYMTPDDAGAYVQANPQAQIIPPADQNPSEAN